MSNYLVLAKYWQYILDDTLFIQMNGEVIADANVSHDIAKRWLGYNQPIEVE